MADHCPLGRCAVPEDVARVVAFLASDDGGWVNGKLQTSSQIYNRSGVLIHERRPSHHHLWRFIAVSVHLARAANRARSHDFRRKRRDVQDGRIDHGRKDSKANMVDSRM